jgi:hypothetical protein
MMSNQQVEVGYSTEWKKFWGKLIADAWGDPALMRRLVLQPDTTIRMLAFEREGWRLGPNYIFAVNRYTGASHVDNERVVVIMPLPPVPKATDASSDVSVLASACCSSSSTCCCC